MGEPVKRSMGWLMVRLVKVGTRVTYRVGRFSTGMTGVKIALTMGCEGCSFSKKMMIDCIFAALLLKKLKKGPEVQEAVLKVAGDATQ